ncbi:hypothetical protein ARMGADRAFT_1121240 [Armillaria gallica]|uniref:Uncharacterized protein n=1 Tax=Armillaria gallica TaxID=47427 RepID=A0A2H3DIN3_ARMGA|nr:hypothetical protein ARMGADRAFT_1121240 [Armillaria gallica]
MGALAGVGRRSQDCDGGPVVARDVCRRELRRSIRNAVGLLVCRSCWERIGGWELSYRRLTALLRRSLGLCNSLTNCLRMYNCVVRVEGEPERYKQRSVMATQLVGEACRDDWEG